MSRLLLVVALLASACRETPWYRCHYRTEVVASDGRLGAPCQARAVKGDEPKKGLVFAETTAATGNPVHGWMKVAKPREPGSIAVELTVRCTGYAPATRPFTWAIGPETCGAPVELGPTRVERVP